MKWLFHFSDGLRQRAQHRVMTRSRALGRRGEDLAHRHLQKLGYRIVARNYRTLSGKHEVDLIAWDGDRLVFVEVKTRSNDETGTPDRAVTPEKQHRITRAAMDYVHASRSDWSQVRFDVLTIVDRKTPEITLFTDAFGPVHSLPARSKIY